MENHNDQTLNPWTSMWLKPRATIQQIITTNPTQYVLLLAALGGIVQVFDRASAKSIGDVISFTTILLSAVLIGPLSGIVGLYLGGFLIRWTGAWIGGTGSSKNIRAAIAWPNVPILYILAIIVFQLILIGPELFTSATPHLDNSIVPALLLVATGITEVIIGIWAFVILLKCLGQVQGFSAWKALANLLMAGLIIIVPLMFFGVLAAVMIPSFI